MEEREIHGFITKHLRYPDIALEFIHDLIHNNKDIQVIILDIKMPPSGKYKDIVTRDGSRTGVAIYADLRMLCPEIPIVVFSNLVDEDLRKVLGQEGPLLRIISKTSSTPDSLVTIIQTITNKSNY
jgi:DNA-binding NarL/FixJ family response regulator